MLMLMVLLSQSTLDTASTALFILSQDDDVYEVDINIKTWGQFYLIDNVSNIQKAVNRISVPGCALALP